MINENPFSLNYTPDHFCDREKELNQLQTNFFNGLNTVIHSPRRLGKSAVIKHLFHQLENERLVETIYVDLYASQNMQDLIQMLAEIVLKKFHQKNFIAGLQQILKGLSPTVSFDRNGTPSFILQINAQQYQTSLEQIFGYLEQKNKKVLVAFDEFQEVATYPDKAEAILRTHIQNLSNVKFIFSGSLGAKRPFYQGAEVIVLDKIDREVYKQFIITTFENQKKSITPEAADYLLDFSDVYTYYTQLICNQCFSQTDKLLTVDMAQQIAANYLESRKFDYENIINLMTENQRKLTIALAKEGAVLKPNAMEFLSKHKLSGASSVNQALKVLLEKQIFFQSTEGIKVYDVFFRRYLEQYF
ncbi:MAG: ATP-binding protein [Bacteroidales bacterium]|nr:ATP-binding protein [Bacteroidales bacterium]